MGTTGRVASAGAPANTVRMLGVVFISAVESYVSRALRSLLLFPCWLLLQLFPRENHPLILALPVRTGALTPAAQASWKLS